MPSRAEIESRQLGLLRSLFARLPAESFYGRKFAGLAAPVSLADFSRDFPFTLKSEIAADQRAFPPFGTILTEPIAHYTRFHQTSGTTSSPIRWLDTPESWQAIGECWMEVFRNAGVTREDRIFFAFSFGPFLGFWMAFDAAQRLGCLCLPAGGMTSAARLRMLLDAQATVLCCTTTYAARLAEAAAQEGIDLSGSKIRRIMVAGEAGGSIPSVRAHLERLWPGASVYDHHGMTEVGPVTYECPATPCRLHVMEGAFIAEIVDSKMGQAVADGETGELVLTNLVRTASPLLRYRTGDVVRGVRRETCACGSSNLALEGGILGRVDDMVVVRGVNIFPSAIDEIVRGFPEVTEYRAVVTTTNALTEMELEIEAASDLRTALERALQAAFSLRIPVRIVPENSLPRSEMKSRRLVRVG